MAARIDWKGTRTEAKGVHGGAPGQPTQRKRVSYFPVPQSHGILAGELPDDVKVACAGHPDPGHRSTRTRVDTAFDAILAMIPESHPDTVVVLLHRIRDGDRAALDQLLGVAYVELHAIAERQMSHERTGHTLQPTALVHEAFLRLIGGATLEFQDRLHFFRAASQTMRRVLVDHARARGAAKRGNGIRITLDHDMVAAEDRTIDLLILDDALTQLAAAEPRWAQVVELRFFAGLDAAEVAEALHTSTATVQRDWRFAKAWLANALLEGGA
jgi:RNA polymerase sigma factor (TIGR02999 family)